MACRLPTRIAGLEQMDSPEVQEWIRNQNQFSNPYLQELPTRELFKQRLTSLWNY